MGRKKEKPVKPKTPGKIETPAKNVSIKKRIKIGLIFFGLFIALIVIGVLGYNLAYLNKILPKTIVGGQNLGGKSKIEANQILAEKLKDSNAVLKITFEKESWELKATDIDLKYDLSQSVNLAWNTGRKGRFGQVAKEQLKSILSGNRYPSALNYDQKKFGEFMAQITQKVDIAEKDPIVELTDSKIQFTAEQTGRRVDLDQNKRKILEAFGNLETKIPLSLIVNASKPKVTQLMAESIRPEIEKILGQEYTLQTDKKDFTLQPKEIAPWVEFSNPNLVKSVKPQLNADKVKTYIASISGDVNQEAKDAKFSISGGRAVAFQLSQTGYELDQEKAVKETTEGILNSQKEIKLSTKTVEPDVSDNSASELGIKEVVGKGTTHFYNSPQNRRHNIQIGAKALHGIMVKPGEEFSALKYISPVNAASGYLPELVILENKTTPQYGGGLCQVSTTLFRAALNTGMEITQRTNHSYRVPYYEPPIGMDATIYEPSPDFRFINNMEHSILIQSFVDDDNSEITFTFYGTKDDRDISISDPVMYAVTAPPEPLYTEDPGLAAGEIKKVDTAHAGAQADFHYKVTLNGKTLQDTNFHSFYTNWPAKYLYGPGTQIPPAE